MKCIVKKAVVLLLCTSFLLCGCQKQLEYTNAYSVNHASSSFNVIPTEDENKLPAYASDLCVVDENILMDGFDLEEVAAAILCDMNNNQVLYSKEAHKRLNPASLTKIMTAYVALKYGSLDQVLTAHNSVNITESGAQLCGLMVGDTMTLNQALYILLMYSANDAAMLIADNVCSSVDEFVDLMNQEAANIGATNTHFANPNGFTEEGHYTTAYDLYLIFNEALSYSKIAEIINLKSYQTTYHDKRGKEKTLSFENTNRYLRGSVTLPDTIQIHGGKTGTTMAAGHCLLLFSRDISGNPYISIILGSNSSDELYEKMTALLNEIDS